MSEELKPCPFCGREPKIKAVMKSYGLTIWCACKCGAQTGGFCPNTSNEDISYIFGDGRIHIFVRLSMQKGM